MFKFAIIVIVTITSSCNQSTCPTYASYKKLNVQTESSYKCVHDKNVY